MLPAPHYSSKDVAVLNEFFKTVLWIKAGSWKVIILLSTILGFWTLSFTEILFDRKACTMYWDSKMLRADHSCLLKSRYFTEANLKEYCTVARVL